MIIPKDIALDSYELILTEDCNLRCKYCFDDYYSDRSECDYDVKMKIDILDDLSAFIMETFNRNKRVRFTFFGGEPLINWEFIEAFVERSKEFKFDCEFSMNTNAILLDTKKIDFIIENRINISLSIDGTQRSHDINRITKGSKGSWELTMKHVPELLSKMKKVNMQANTLMVVNKNNYEHIAESYEFLAIKLGIITNILFDYTDDVSSKYLESINKQLEYLFVEKRFIPFVDLNNRILKPKELLKQNNYCFTPDRNVTISPSGKLFFCHQFVPKMYEIDSSFNQYYGDIKDGYTNSDYYYSFKNRCNFELFKKGKECEECIVSMWCKGGCLAGHWHGCALSYKVDEIKDDKFNINENLCKINKTLHSLREKIIF